MSEVEISIEEAKPDKLFYVVANMVVINPNDQTFLLLRRSLDEKVLPGKWGFPGGKLEHQDVAKLLIETDGQSVPGVDNILGKLATREVKEESGLIVSEDCTVVTNKVFIRPDKVPVFMTTLVNRYEGGEVKLTEGSIIDYAWVSLDQLKDFDCIPDIEDEAKKALRLFKS